MSHPTSPIKKLLKVSSRLLYEKKLINMQAIYDNGLYLHRLYMGWKFTNIQQKFLMVSLVHCNNGMECICTELYNKNTIMTLTN